MHTPSAFFTRQIRRQRVLRKMANMRAAKARKRPENRSKQQPKFERYFPLELGVRDKRTGQTAWTDLRSVRDAAKRLSVILKYYLALLVFWSLGAWMFAADVPLAWDASPSPGVDAYFLTATNLSSPLPSPVPLAAPLRVDVGTNLTVTVTNLSPGQWAFRTFAVRAGIVSDPSNTLLVEVPQAPASLRIVILQYSASLTNFSDAGFFRVQITP